MARKFSFQNLDIYETNFKMIFNLTDLKLMIFKTNSYFEVRKLEKKISKWACANGFWEKCRIIWNYPINFGKEKTCPMKRY